jgi:carboxylate-amine ligase
MSSRFLHLFEGYGIELEYMVVDATTLKVKPIVDELFHSVAGEYVSDIRQGTIEWSNELVAHVLELKTSGPVTKLESLDEAFSENIRKINQLLKAQNAKLLPTGMHPLMDPTLETRIWPHGNNEIYETYNRIFNCKGHGWSNLQSMHINFPFFDESEFGRLHAAIRFLLPILPVLSASSPLVEGALTGISDNRLNFYVQNQKAIPEIAGQVIPEPAFTFIDYQQKILEKTYKAIAPHDPEGDMQEDWLNSRGAIARFGRQTIEIRTLDTQECPKADISIAILITHILKSLISEKWISYNDQKMTDTISLRTIFDACSKYSGYASITDPEYLALLGLPAKKAISTKDIWFHLMEITGFQNECPPRNYQAIETILKRGALSDRISQTTGANPSKIEIIDLYKKLANCLYQNVLFEP